VTLSWSIFTIVLLGANHYGMLLLAFINVAAYIAEQMEASIPRNRF